MHTTEYLFIHSFNHMYMDVITYVSGIRRRSFETQPCKELSTTT